jgi:prepilin-type N-terminal cleavage/methylation domain-containing protein
MRNPAHNRSGFTLIEVVISLAIFSGIVLAVTGFRANLDTLRNIAYQRLQSRQDMNQTMQILVTEIRSAGPSSIGNFSIVEAATSSFIFYSDIDKDGSFERVRYFLPVTGATTTLKKGVIKPTGNPLAYVSSSETISTVAENVVPSSTLPYFQYFGTAYTGSESAMSYPVDVSQIRLVRANFFVDIRPQVAPIPIFFSETINIRNLRSN